MALLVIAPLLGGCGDSTTHDPVVETVSAYVDAVVGGEGKVACDLLTEKESRSVLQEVKREFPKLKTRSCAEAYSKVSKTLTPLTKKRLLAGAAALRFEQGTILAELELPGFSSVIRPRFRGDRWRISEGLNLKPMWSDLSAGSWR